MRTLILLALLLLSTSLRSAPEPTPEKLNSLEAGTVVVGGAAAFHLDERTFFEGGSVKTVSLSAPIRYFLLDWLAVGASLSATHTSTTKASGASTHSTVYGAGPGATIYFWSQDRLATYLGTSVVGNFNPDAPTNVTFNASLGLDFFPYRRIALGPQLHFAYTTENGPQAKGGNFFELSFSFSVFL